MHQLKTLKNGIIIKVFLCLNASITVCLCAYVFVFRRHLLSICQRLCSFIAFYAFFMSLVFRPTRLTASCLTSMLLEATPIEIRASAIALHPLVLSSLFLILWSFLHCSSFSGYFFILLSFLPPPTHDFTSNYLIRLQIADR